MNASAGAGLSHYYFGELRQYGFEFIPDPKSKIFAGGIFETRYVVKTAMIELFLKWSEGFL